MRIDFSSPFVRVYVVALVLSALAGCSIVPGMHFQADENMPPVTAITPALLAAQGNDSDMPGMDAAIALLSVPERAYRIGAADVLSIQVWNHPEIGMSVVAAPRAGNGDAPAFTVGEDGVIVYPYVGAVQVAGLTIGDVQRNLTSAIAHYVRDPKVAVSVAAYRSQQVFVDGAVKNPGAKPVTNVPMTLAYALAEAGGVQPDGDASRVLVSRDGKTVRVDLPAMAAAGKRAEALYLRANDKVRVVARADNPVFVAGEVGRAQAVPMQDGRLSLAQAIAAAGSVNANTSQPSGVYVVRPKADGTPQVFQLDAKSPTGLAMAARFALQANDLVYVEAAGLMKWNRVVSLLLPTSQSLYNTQRATSGN
jgi:polysaccharide export outer membrane protein